MSDEAYATRSDVYDYGLSRGAIANPARLCASVLAATDAFELDGHGFETDAELIFRAESGGVLPAPIVAGEAYYAIRENEQTFKVAAAVRGAPIDLTTDGAAVLVMTPLPFEKVLKFYSRFVDPFLPAHLVPLTPPYPDTVVGIVAQLSARLLQNIAGQQSNSMTEIQIAAKAQLERWAKGLPLRDARATAPANLSYSESAPAPSTRNWDAGRAVGGGGTLP